MAQRGDVSTKAIAVTPQLVGNDKNQVEEGNEVVGWDEIDMEWNEPDEPNDSDDAAKQMQKETKKELASIVQGLALNRVIWSGNVCYDGWFFLKNNHPLLGIFLCHRMHPFKHYMRALVWLALAMGNIGLMAFFIDPDTGKKRTDIEAKTQLLKDHAKENWERRSLSWPDYHIGDVELSLAGSLVLTVIAFLISQCYVCRCARAGGKCWFGGKWMHRCFLNAGKLIVIIALMLAVAMLFVGVGRAYEEEVLPEMVARAWAMTEFYNFFLGLAMNSCLFLGYWYGLPCGNRCFSCCLGTGQHGEQGRRPVGSYPHGLEYPKDKRSFWEGDRCGCYCPRHTEDRNG